MTGSTATGVGWVLCLHVGAAGSMATVGFLNLQWWWRDRSYRFLAATGLLCWSVALTLAVGAAGLFLPEADVFRVVVPVRALFIGITAALFVATLGTLVSLPALRAAVAAQLLLPVAYVGFGLTGDAAYTFGGGSPWPMMQPVGKALVGGCALIFFSYSVLAWWRLTGTLRRDLAVATISVLAILFIPALSGAGWLMEAMSSLWTLPIAILLAWWCSTRVLTLQGSLVSASEGRLRAESAARHLARHDPLTGLANLDGALEELQSLLADPQTPVLVAQFQVRGLEQVRAATGSAAADSVLRTIAAHLMAVLPAEARVARVREAAFMVTMPVPAQPPDVELVEYAEQALSLLRRATDLPRNLLVSVGIAISHPTSTAAELVQEVGTALIAAQQARGRVQVYRPELRQELLARARITRLLAVATERDEFELHYQPIVDTTTCARVGVEALVRWRHHGRLHPPAEWIPIAEEEGLMPAIGLRVLQLAARDVPAIGCPIAVNVSARQLVDPEFVGNVLDTLRDLPRHSIVLEITESSVMADLDQTQTALAVFRSNGIRIAIDDFGTEYSSLSRLATVPFDILKIDRSFVTAVTTPHGRPIVTAIHALARALGKTTVAEGVETQEELRALTDIGCDRVQGFLTGRPVPLDELLATEPSTATEGAATAAGRSAGRADSAARWRN